MKVPATPLFMKTGALVGMSDKTDDKYIQEQRELVQAAFTPPVPLVTAVPPPAPCPDAIDSKNGYPGLPKQASLFLDSREPTVDLGDKWGTTGPKFDGGKLRWSLLPAGTVMEVVKVMEYGAVKYAIDSWKKVPNGRVRYYDAAMRHMEAWYNGEVKDPETGLHHLAHATCNLFFLMFKDKETK